MKKNCPYRILWLKEIKTTKNNIIRSEKWSTFLYSLRDYRTFPIIFNVCESRSKNVIDVTLYGYYNCYLKGKRYKRFHMKLGWLLHPMLLFFIFILFIIVCIFTYATTLNYALMEGKMHLNKSWERFSFFFVVEYLMVFQHTLCSLNTRAINFCLTFALYNFRIKLIFNQFDTLMISTFYIKMKKGEMK